MKFVIKKHKTGNKGVALLTVLVSVFIISLLTIEFQYSVAIERKLSYSDLNQLQAHYLAKSGVKFALLRLVLFSRANKDKSLDSVKTFLPAIWNLPIPAFPPAKSKIKQLFKADQDAAEKAIEETKISIGQFTETISSESAKINLNFLLIPVAQQGQSSVNILNQSNSPQKGLHLYVATLLLNTISQIFKESENPVEDFGNVRPEEVVCDIMEWVNPSPVSCGSGNKDSFYEQQKPSYKSKKGRFFTLEELKLVKSIGDNLYKKLKPFVTVFSYDGNIDLNGASKDVLKAIYPDFTDDDLNKIQEEKNKIGRWYSKEDFVAFVVGPLNRSGFRSSYPVPADYPFTVSNYSFIIEGIGTIPKSKYVIQKRIRVAVALTAATPTDKITCEKDDLYFWNSTTQVCTKKPNNQSECEFIVGQWVPGGCEILDPGKRTIPPPSGSKPAVEPNALKILYWMET